jgi:hypothetical protein
MEAEGDVDDLVGSVSGDSKPTEGKVTDLGFEGSDQG